MRYLQIYTLIFSFVFCICCKEQKKDDPLKNSISPTAGESTNSFIPIEEVETVIMPNAPSKIRKDKEGNLLIAAFTDVILYDGKSFSKIPKPEGFESFDAFDALQDSKGNIWIASTHYGVFRYDGKNFKHFTTEAGLAHNRTIGIYEDKSGNIWFATAGGASLYDGISFRNFTTKDGLPSNGVNTIFEDKNGKFWFGTDGNAHIYDGKTFTTVTNKDGKPFTNVRSIIEDKKGNIWLGGNDGLWRHDGSTFTNLTQNFVGYIYEDKKGNILTTSTESAHGKSWKLSRYDEKSLSDQKPTITEIKSGGKMYFGILEANDGSIWFGMLDGVYRYAGNTINTFKDKED